MSQRADERTVLEETLIVDADVHLSIPDEALIPYLEMPHRSRMQNTKHTSPDDGWDRSVNGKIPMNTEDGKYEGVSSAADLYENVCRDLHVDYPIINTFAAMSRNPEPEWSMALMRAHNDLLLDEFLDEYDEFRGLITLTTQNPAEAAEELDRVGDEANMAGVYVHNTGPNPPLGDPTYDVMWRAVEDHDYPVVFHGSANGFMYEFPRQNQGLNSFLPVHTLAHAWTQMLTVASLIAEGTPEKFPGIDWVFLEAGVTWFPYMMWRLNKEYAMRRSEVPVLERSPEAYMRDSFYVGSQPVEEPNDPSDLDGVIEAMGTEQLLFATDYPHWDFDHPEALDGQLRSRYTAEERDRILHGNAIDVFDLNL
jgi:predicted TIM-barrel fold metal-dependent hydrolase